MASEQSRRERFRILLQETAKVKNYEKRKAEYDVREEARQERKRNKREEREKKRHREEEEREEEIAGESISDWLVCWSSKSYRYVDSIDSIRSNERKYF